MRKDPCRVQKSAQQHQSRRSEPGSVVCGGVKLPSAFVARLQEPYEQEWQQEREEWYRGSSERSSEDRSRSSQQLRQQPRQHQQQEDEDSIEEVVRLHQQQLLQQQLQQNQHYLGPGSGPSVRRRSAGVQVGGASGCSGGVGGRGFVAAVGGVVGQGFLALRRTRVRAGCAS
ncbi:mediator of RNA polymerase II transcription subunit 25-like [Anopheles stephensi]|uniref:Uncharacterized protein n=1 Tax=Anopheles stephensi TaxID=30069 RepID=A0A182XXL9_ANOST|nr:mediator of RNA polymerase II transcription subunit 25-like [Anopheles stephensi]